MSDSTTITDATIPADHVADADDYALINAELRAEVDRLRATVASVTRAPQPLSHSEARPAISADKFERTVGRVAILNMSRDQKVAGLGHDPASIKDSYVRSLFGKGNSGVEAADLMRANPKRYRELKEVALLLNIYGM